ncbi:hypothetical protein F5I97DRAFT_1507385 [Phlebopus sp. FC_14]|nr:hypothetical protein F5I97DRAFT_1507385 [Phlebopus sp. FC_14]
MALQSRPEPMNASPHHSKVKVTLTLSDPVFVSGGNISGKMEVESRADLDAVLGIGVMMVELFAIQEINSPDHSATSTFIQSRRLFQGPGLPPSNAVHPDYLPGSGELPLPAHHYAARRGLTTFFFRFSLPHSSPSSITFGPASIRYEVRASVGVAWRGDRRLVTDKREVKVVENLDALADGQPQQAGTIAEGGKIWAQATITSGAVIAGESASIDLQLKNHSQRWTSGITLTLTRELHLSESLLAGKKPHGVSELVTQVDFRGPEYSVPPGIEGVASLVIDIPRRSRGAKGGPRFDDSGKTTDGLFEVRCVLSIRIEMSSGSEDTVITLPVTIHHLQAIPEAPVSHHAFTPPDPYTSPSFVGLPLSPPPEALSMDCHPSNQPSYYGPVWASPATQPGYEPLPADLYDGQWQQHLNPYGLPLQRSTSAGPLPQIPHYKPALPVARSPSARLLPPPPVPPFHSCYPPYLADIQGSPGYNADVIEEGKGVRASRISQNLHDSVCHRSVSPRSHRYPLPLAPSEAQAPHPATPARVFPAPIQVPKLPNPHDSQGVLHSPRPVPSPKHSFSGSVPKSERVSALERMADEVGIQTGDLSADLPKGNAGESGGVQSHDPEPHRDKTLPGPPVPSSKDRPLLPQRPRANTMFPKEHMLDRLYPEVPSDSIHCAPPTPPIAAITPFKFPRAPAEPHGLEANLGKDVAQESGLDALERRLLAEVGTRRLDSETRPDVRSIVQPITIPPSGPPDGVNDSAISSLTLADRNGFLTGEDNAPEREQEQDRDSDERTQHLGGGQSQSDDDRDARTQKGKSLHKYGKSKHSDEDIERVGRRRERKKSKVDEGRKLRKEAKGRIAAWLGEIDTATPPIVDDTLSLVSPSASHFVPIVESKSFGPPPPQEKEKSRQRRGDINAANDISAAPNPRSSGFKTISTLAAHSGSTTEPSFKQSPRRSSVNDLPQPSPSQHRVERRPIPRSPTRDPEPPQQSAPPRAMPPQTEQHIAPRLLRFPPQAVDPEVKYDVRSARGGRGGKVTQVASLWAAKTRAAEAAAKQNTTPAPPRPIRKPVPTVVKPVAKRSSPVSATTTDGPVNMKNGVEKRTKPAKATSVPAVVSSSHAVPMLSSTASLARVPTANSAKPSHLPPMISETISDIRSLPKSPSPRPGRQLGDLAFGQARLRDLIKKYQG